MSEQGRNAPCACGSGAKYKQCCLRRADEAARDVAWAEHVWQQMQSWAREHFRDEFDREIAGHLRACGLGTRDEPATDGDLSLGLCWLLIDHELTARGGTLAQRYADLPGLSSGERDAAARIAASRLGLYRVRDVAPGAWIDIENVLDGVRTRVASPQVSLATVRWHVLLARLMPGGPEPTLWGAAALYEPSEEEDLLAELERIAAARGRGTGPDALAMALRDGASELLRFLPARRRARRVPYTREGHVAVDATASWRVRDPGAAWDMLSQAPELSSAGESEDGEGLVLNWLTSRSGLSARRGTLPAGAMLIETTLISRDEDDHLALEDVTSLGTFILRGELLEFSAISAERLDGALALVEHLLGDLVSDPTRRVRPLERARADARSRDAGAPRRSAAPAADAPEELIPDDVLRLLLHRRWLDTPNDQLGGLSPREAGARGEQTERLESLLRGLEHHSALQRAERRPGPEVAFLRAELGLALV
jgi:hypothetical protein